MQAETALHAVRILSVDVANLSARVAVLQAASEEMAEIALRIDTRLWNDTAVAEGDQTRHLVTMPPEQRDLLEALLGLVQGLS